MSVTFERLFRMAKPFADHSDLKSALTPMSRACNRRQNDMNGALYLDIVLLAQGGLVLDRKFKC